MGKRMISLEEQKRISQEILNYIADFCEKNDIRYYLAYGTLLGAVRHKGFIPWDDDIDIVMFRADYMKFLSLFQSEKYHCLSFENQTYYRPFTKIVDSRTAMIHDNAIPLEKMGVAVDIFPFDYLADSKTEAEKIKKKLTMKFKLLRYALYPSLNELIQKKFPLSSLVFYCIAKPFGWKFWARIYKRKVKKLISLENKKYCGYLLPFDFKTEFAYKSSLFFEIDEYVFNDAVYTSVKDSDELLTQMYGDYMKLPPEDKRIPHLANAYYRE